MLSREQQQIIEDSLWVVNTALKKQGLQGDEDLRQTAIMYMCKCLERFDPSKNIKWTTFAYKNVYLFIRRTSLRAIRTAIPIAKNDIYSYIENVGCIETYEINDEKRQIRDIKALCTPQECKLIELKLKGYKWAEISEKMGVSVSKAIICMQSIKEKAKEIER